MVPGVPFFYTLLHFTLIVYLSFSHCFTYTYTYFLKNTCKLYAHLQLSHCPLSTQAAAPAHRLQRFSHYHHQWLADCVQEKDRESCNHWFLHQSTKMATVMEVEEYRSGIVRHRYSTRARLSAKVHTQRLGTPEHLVVYSYSIGQVL